jgi:hypothetical protein
MKKEKLITEIERLFIHRRSDYAQQVRIRDKEKRRWIWIFKRKSEPITKEIFIGHRLGPPFLPKSLSVDMRIKCLALINIHYSFKGSLN